MVPAAVGERQHRSAVVQTVRTIPARGGGGGLRAGDASVLWAAHLFIGGETTLRRENVQLPNFTGKQAVIVAPRWYQANSPTGPQRSIVMRRIRPGPQPT